MAAIRARCSSRGRSTVWVTGETIEHAISFTVSEAKRLYRRSPKTGGAPLAAGDFSRTGVHGASREHWPTILAVHHQGHGRGLTNAAPPFSAQAKPLDATASKRVQGLMAACAMPSEPRRGDDHRGGLPSRYRKSPSRGGPGRALLLPPLRNTVGGVPIMARLG